MATPATVYQHPRCAHEHLLCSTNLFLSKVLRLIANPLRVGASARGPWAPRNVARRYVRLTLAVTPQATHLTLKVDSTSGHVSAVLTFVPAHASAVIAPVARFHRGGATTATASTTASATTVSTQGHASSRDAMPNNGGSVRLSIVPEAERPDRVALTISRASSQMPHLSSSSVGVPQTPSQPPTGTDSITDNSMGLRYAKGPDGTRGFHSTGGSIRPRTGLLPPSLQREVTVDMADESVASEMVLQGD